MATKATKTGSELAMQQERGVAFTYNGTEVLFNDQRLVNLNNMWQASGCPANQEPAAWLRLTSTRGFIEDLMKSHKPEIMDKTQVIATSRGRKGSVHAHWQVAMAYAKYLSHEFHRFVNEAFREWVEEKRDPALKVDRAISAFKKMGKTDEWINHRIRGIAHRKQLTGTMKDHNCKVRGKNDNPFAEATRSISLAAIGKTPREYKAEKGLAKSARTRNFHEEEELVAIDLIELYAAKGIKEQGADGNDECVAVVKKVSRAIGGALNSLRLSG